MLPIKFTKVIYFSTSPEVSAKFSCLSDSIDIKVKSNKQYLYKLYVYEPDYDNESE